MTHHLILGAGPAGVIAAETIRQNNSDSTITIVGDEHEPPYSRMAIPYLLIGNVNESGTYLRQEEGHWDKLRINLIRARASSIDTKKREAHLDNGQVISFDTLLVATGSVPITPPISGIDLPGVHTCWTLADARKIMALAQPGTQVLQLGAGFIGCIIMEALAARGVKLSVVEMGDRMVPRMMGSTAGTMIREWCETKGVEVFTGTKVESISSGQPLTVHLSNGQNVKANLVISAAGVKPAIGFLEKSGIDCEIGVLSDFYMQSNVPGVFAAGDCAQAIDKVTGKRVVSAIQPTAAEQARVAALNMIAYVKGVDMHAVLNCVPQINVLDTLGLISSSFGLWEGVAGGESVELTDTAAGKHLSLQFKDDVLIGCNSVGWTSHVGVMRGLVEGRVKLGSWKDVLLKDPTQLMPAYLASAQGQGQWTGAQDERRR